MSYNGTGSLDITRVKRGCAASGQLCMGDVHIVTFGLTRSLAGEAARLLTR